MKARPASAQGHGRFWVGLLPWVWMLFFFVLPFALIVNVSLSTPDLAVPPYVSPFAGAAADGAPAFRPDPASYARLGGELAALGTLAADRPYLAAYANSLLLATLTTLCCLVLGYPFAYRLARAPEAMRNLLLMLVMLPFWTSFLLRVYAWMGLLDSSETGLINQVLLGLGLVAEPLPLLYNTGAVLVGMVYSYLPFMVLPLYANLVKLDQRLPEAARDLGARPATVFLRITLPLSSRGIVAGSMLVFIPAVGEFVIPDLLGGGSVMTIGRSIWDDFGPNQDWPMAAAVAVLMVAMLIAPIVLLQRHGRGAGRDE
ncbi:MAG TPA: ABC transporter permease subunit [Thauera aminoaromatica]|nr:ABC transporter permease subunit [Thauera sp. UPWRP]HMV93498.1 ABC transporter permease subunit [Thauera aminoaromatica]HNB04566.1 ABC transporter permease subunit [Thauera aminoaromatica]HND57147.1 ABC transporter permease subunit [Thauera aminoaromatica]HNE98545.1 ABC transporter permease subunit [Thauera aminoaromatica]